MKIIDVKTFTIKNTCTSKGGLYWFFIKLTTDSGTEGWGEIYWNTYSPMSLKSVVADMVEKHVIDEDPFNVELMWQKLYRYHCKQHPDLSKMGIISGIEMACWDIIGKEVGRPVYSLLGGLYNEKLRTYSYIYEENDNEWHESLWYNPERAAARAYDYVRMGFSAIKLDPVPLSDAVAPPYHPSIQIMDNAENVIKSIREAVGSRCDIIIGTHGQMTPAAAIRLAKRLEKYDPLWFEEPIPPGNSHMTSKVSSSTSIPIAVGERLTTKYEFMQLFKENAVDIVQLDLGGVGGILESKKIAAIAEAHHAQITPHFWGGSINFAAQVQLCVCSPNFIIQETIDMMNGFHNRILKNQIIWQDGYIIPSQRPGLGYEIDESALKKYVINEFEERDPLMG